MASKKPTRKPTKTATKVRPPVARRSHSSGWVPWVAGGVVVAVILVAVAVLSTRKSTFTQNAAAAPIGVQTFPSPSYSHVNGTVKYPQNPPVGGDHNGVWLNCGIYTSPVTNENAVHSMEHGAVWITYDPKKVNSSGVQTLTDLVNNHDDPNSRFVLLSPYNNLPSPVVASAWGVQLKVQSVGDSRLSQFIDHYRQGPQTREPGSACSGGTGTPQ